MVTFTRFIECLLSLLLLLAGWQRFASGVGVRCPHRNYRALSVHDCGDELVWGGGDDWAGSSGSQPELSPAFRFAWLSASPEPLAAMAPSARHSWSVDLTAPDETSGRVMPELLKPPGYGEKERDDSVRSISFYACLFSLQSYLHRRAEASRNGSYFSAVIVTSAQEEKIVAKKGDIMKLKLQKAREIAWSPGKNFMMTAFMLWMSGSGVHIFSIMITFYAVYNPIKSAFTVQQQFTRFEDSKMGGPSAPAFCRRN